jgi:hypothetical protein
MSATQNNKTLDAIYNSGLIFLSAQPDTTYFHWQVQVYLHNFAKFGIVDRCHVLFSYEDEPSKEIQALAEHYHIHWYKDDRTAEQRDYVPSICQMLYKKFFQKFPNLGKYVFIHDSDIIFRELPKFELLLADNVCYLSDTVSYIGYKYLIGCSKRYKKKYKQLPDKDLVIRMCKEVDIDINIIENNEENSGGAQYLLKNVTVELCEQMELSTHILHNFFKDYRKQFPINHHVQSWCAGMWGMLWEIWKSGRPTKISKDLSFSWGTSSTPEYMRHNILHMAGVTSANKKGKFCKSDYINVKLLEQFNDNPDMFDYVEDNASRKYVEEIAECADVRFGEYVHPPANIAKGAFFILMMILLAMTIVYVVRLNLKN